MRNKENAFTLIELVAVLVIMAIIALIATPLVLSLINNAKASANKRSVDAYGKAVELAAMTYLMDNGEYPTDLRSLTVEYTGKEVACNVMTLNNDGSLYLSECSVGGSEVKDKKTDDGWYHYGDTSKGGSGTQVAPTLDPNVGKLVTYKGMDFYVINDDSNNDYVTLLKAEPLDPDFLGESYYKYVNVAVERDRYGRDYSDGVAYYSRNNCGFYAISEYDDMEMMDIYYYEFLSENCTTDYDESDIKKIVDEWASYYLYDPEIMENDLVEDEYGYRARLITVDELIGKLGFWGNMSTISGSRFEASSSTPEWVFDTPYWTMSTENDWDHVWQVTESGYAIGEGIYYPTANVRPVINLSRDIYNNL